MYGAGKMLRRGKGKWQSEKQVSRIRTGLSANAFRSQKNEKGMLQGRELEDLSPWNPIHGLA